MLFYHFFHREKFPDIPVSLVSELHNYSTRRASSIKFQFPDFKLILGDFAPALLQVSFGMTFRNASGTNHLKKVHFYADTFLNTNVTLSLL